MNTHKLRTDKLFYILFAIFYFWMAAQIPYTHDDWDWGLDIGIQQWLTASVNSRYVGNFFEVIMTRSPALKTLIMGGGYFAIPYLLSRLAASFNREKKNHTFFLFLVANFLMLTMSRKIWSETYGWVAGFANFSISSVFMLLIFAIWLPLLEEDYTAASLSKRYTLLFFLLSIACQLFIENLSIVMVMTSFAACVMSYIRTKRIPSQYIVIALGTIIGLAIMFSSSVYSALFETGKAVDGYRELIITTEGSLAGKLFGFFTHCARLAVRAGETNTVLCVSVLLTLMFEMYRNRSLYTRRKKILLTGFDCILLVYFIVNFALQSDYSANDPVRAAIAAIVNAVYFLGVLVEIWIIYRNDPILKRKLITLWCLAIAVIAPLIITTEAGYRLMFTMNVIITLFIVTIVGNQIREIGDEQIRKPVRLYLIAVLIPVLVCFHVYSAIGACTTERLTRIETASASQAKQLTLPQYPYEEYMQFPDPSMEFRWPFFREFYGIAEDVEITIEPIH